MHESVFMHSSLKLPFQNQYYRIINTLIMKDSSQSRFLLPSLTLPNIFLAQVFPSLFFIISFVDLEIEWYFRLVWSLPVSYSFSLSLSLFSCSYFISRLLKVILYVGSFNSECMYDVALYAVLCEFNWEPIHPRKFGVARAPIHTMWHRLLWYTESERVKER